MKNRLSTYLLKSAMIGSLALSQTLYAQDRQELETLVIESSKLQGEQREIPARITLIDKATIESQLDVVDSVSELLSKMLPGFSNSRNRLTSFGENFRGREALYLIDGVPQSNPLRAGGRSSETIDLSQIERIEIIHGPSLAQGMGAVGGAINLITKKSEQEGIKHTIEMSVGNSGLKGTGTDYGFHYGIDASLTDTLSLVGGFAYKVRGLNFDGNGNPVGLELVQGDLADSKGYDAFAKINFALSDSQSISAMFNTFDVKGNGDYGNEAGEATDEHTGNTFIQAKEDALKFGQAPENIVYTTTANYTNDDLMGGTLKAQAFLQDFKAVYGMYTGVYFYDPADPDRNGDQSRNNSHKIGFKGNYILPLSDMIKVSAGLDYLQDSTKQDLVHAGTQWVPSTTYSDISPYALGNVNLDTPMGITTINAGVRYTTANLAVKDFTTITTKSKAKDGTISVNKGVEVKGGTPNYSKMLFNVGAVNNMDDFRIYASYNQGFGMGDVGRVLRAIKKTGVTIDNDYLDVKPIITNNYEVGVDYFIGDEGSVGIDYYMSASDFGQRMEYLADIDLYKPKREKTDISGFNVKADYTIADDYTIGGYYSFISSKGDYTLKKEDGTEEVKQVDLLARYGNAPDKISLFAEGLLFDSLFVRVQSSTLLDKSIQSTPDEKSKKDFKGYTTVDLLSRYKITDSSSVSFGVSNLLGTQYATWYSQMAQTAKNFFAGEGRVIKVSYKMEF